MKNRCLFLIESVQIEIKFIKKLCEIAEAYEEIVFVLRDADSLNDKKLKTGDLLEILQHMLKSVCKVPFFVIPFAAKGARGLAYWLKLKLLIPNFSKLYSTNTKDKIAAQQILNCSFELLQIDFKQNDSKPTYQKKSIKRGLFITRAQPLHNGHAAFIEQMATENEEFIVLLAAAEQSHQPKNPLSARERLEMVNSYLNHHYKHRFYLVALPQNHFTLENMYELTYLLPEFHSVYATNPIIESMCKSMRISVNSLGEKVKISATEIRSKILKNESCEELLPAPILNYLQEIDFQERLKIINHQYER